MHEQVELHTFSCVRDRYWSALARLQYSEASAMGAQSMIDSLARVTTGVAVVVGQHAGGARHSTDRNGRRWSA
jgi:hypothetical protein